MWPYLLLAAFTVLLWLIHYCGFLGRKGFLVLAFVPACALLALRGPNVGEDTCMYLQMATVADGMTWEGLSHVGSSIIWNMDQYGYGSSVNVGFLVLCKAVMAVSGSGEAVQVFCAIVTCALVGRFIYKNTDNVGLAYWVFLCGGIFMFAFNGMRQMLALAVAAQSYESLKNQRVCLAVIWVVLASLLHTSALVFVVFLIMYVATNSEKVLKPALLACLLLPLMMPALQFVTKMISNQYASYFQNNYWQASVGGIVFIWILTLSSLLAVCCKDKSHDGRFAALMAGIYLSLSVMSLQVSIFERVALYPQIFLLILFPLCLKTISEKNRWWYGAVAVSLLFFLYVSYAANPARVYMMFV